MGFFSDIGKKTSETTSKIARETKLKMKINENKGKIADLYEIIGKKVYEKHIKEETAGFEEFLNVELAKLDELSKEIEDARIEILKLNQKKMCQNCATEIEKNAQFCPKCGQKQNIEEPTVEEKALEKLENTEIAPEKEEDAEIVKEELQEKIDTNSDITSDDEENKTENN